MRYIWEILIAPPLLVLLVVILIPIVVYAPVVLKFIGIWLLICVIVGVVLGIYKLIRK